MSKIAAAAIGGSVVSGLFGDRASKRAAETAQQGQEAQLAYLERQGQLAREETAPLYNQAMDTRRQGSQRQIDMLSAAAPMVLDARQQGNMNAQNVLAGSMPQMQNALLGTGPIDYSFMQPRQVNVDLQGLLAGIPQVYNQQQQQAAPNPAPVAPVSNPTMVNPLSAPNFRFGSFNFGGNDFLTNRNLR